MSLDAHPLVRSEFDAIRSPYFNTAYRGPSPARSHRYATEILGREIDPRGWHYDDWVSEPETTRQLFANLLGVDVDSVAHHSAVSDAVSQIVQALHFEPGDFVVLPQSDFPSNILPWRRNQEFRNYQLHTIPNSHLEDIEKLAAELPPKTRVINFSHVAFDTGHVAHLSALADLFAEREIFSIVDLTQSFGGISIAGTVLSKLDIVLCATYKWLLGPYGHAFGYYSEKAIDTLTSRSVGFYNTVGWKNPDLLTMYEMTPARGARRYDRGQTASLLNLAVLQGGLEVLQDVGLENIEIHNRQLVKHFLKNLGECDTELNVVGNAAANIVSVQTDSDPRALESELEKKGIDVTVRNGRLRISFHLFNTRSEVDVLLNLLSRQ